MAVFDTVAYLLEETVRQDLALNQVKTYKERKVYVRWARSIYMNEFYEAAAQGLKPEAVLAVFFSDYKGEKIVRWRDVFYKVTRAFQAPASDNIELTIERTVEPIKMEEVCCHE